MEFGVNVPWFHGAYGHDLGPNQAHPNWPIAFDLVEVRQLLDLLREFKVQLVRIWLFEQAEGLRFNSDGAVEAIDSRFLNNLELLCESLAEREIRAYWTLLDANSAFRNSDACTFAILTDRRASDSFCKVALSTVVPILTETAWAIDLCSEPEAIIRGPFGNGSGHGVTWAEVLPNLSVLRDHAKIVGPAIPLSVGSGFTEQINLRDNQAYIEFCRQLDFLDYHTYKQGVDILPKASCAVGEMAHRPWVLGEVGCRIDPAHRRDRKAWLDGQEQLSIKSHRLLDMGYDAAFLWFASNMSVQDATSLFFADEPGRALHTLAKLTSSKAAKAVRFA